MDELDPERIVNVDILSDETRTNWRKLAAEWATMPPFYVFNFGIPQVVTSRHADVRAVYSQPSTFSQNRPADAGKGDEMMRSLPRLGSMDGAPHRRLRTLLAPWFNAAGVDGFEPTIKAEIEQLVDELEASAQDNVVDIVPQFSNKLIPRILLGRMFGLNEERQQVFLELRAQRDLLASVSGFPESYVESFKRARSVVDEVIAERKANPQDDFIGGLVAAYVRGEPISYDEIVGSLFQLFFAALMTTSIVTTVLLYTWMREREQFELIYSEPDLIWSAVEESLRLHPPGITGNVRFATEDTEIGGTKIWQGMPVFAAIVAANLDPTVYPDPLRFDIRRDPKRILTFGTGPHYCIGSILAQRIMATSLRTFMRRFPNLQLVEPNFELRYYGQIGELSPIELPMRLN